MKNKILTLLITLISITGFSQNSNENVLYIVDSIPIIEEPKEGFGILTENEIDRVEVVKDLKIIQSKGYKDLDGIIYVFTKAYAQRPDSIKAIPSTNQMTKKDRTWYLKNNSSPYTGKFIDYYLNGQKEGEGTLFNGRLKGIRNQYHLNGNLFYVFEYDYGISNGIEERYREDGSLIQKGNNKNGIRIGVWEMFHPNGQLQLRTTYNEYGKKDGTTYSYYSTGMLKGNNRFENGIYVKDKINDKIFNYYNQGQVLFKQGKFKSAIKKYSKCIELDENWTDGYFARGTAKMEMMKFDEAITDFNSVLKIEPFYTYAYANRGFALMRKYEFKNSRTIKKIEGIRIMATKETEIPKTELTKICEDLNKAVSLGDNNWMVLEAVKKHCEK